MTDADCIVMGARPGAIVGVNTSVRTAQHTASWQAATARTRRGNGDPVRVRSRVPAARQAAAHAREPWGAHVYVVGGADPGVAGGAPFTPPPGVVCPSGTVFGVMVDLRARVSGRGRACAGQDAQDVRDRDPGGVRGDDFDNTSARAARTPGSTNRRRQPRAHSRVHHRRRHRGDAGERRAARGSARRAHAEAGAGYRVVASTPPARSVESETTMVWPRLRTRGTGERPHGDRWAAHRTGQSS
jgi:hypothetical protein